jgi:hypothetical protein
VLYSLARSDLGSLLHEASFPIGTAADVSGPDINMIASAIAADTEQFEIAFNAGGQVVNDTITLVALAAAA